MGWLCGVVGVALVVGTEAFQLAGVGAGRRRTVAWGWGEEVSFGEVEVVSNDEAGKDLRSLSIQVPAATAESFTIPGQFVQMKVGDGKPGFYAIASPPTNGSAFEFLIKKTEGNEWLTGATAGSALDMSGAMGKGYDYLTHFEGDSAAVNPDYDGFACMNILFLSQGTGIAPVRSAIEHGIAIGLPKPATLYYGVRDAASRAYADKFDAWTSDFNVDVVEVRSRPEPDWTGPTGYVQDTLKAQGIKVPRNAGAIVCGNKDFFVANKDVLLDAGLFEGRILTNF